MGPPEVHLPGDAPMLLGDVRLQLLPEAPEAGTPGQAPQPRQQQLRVQVRVLPLAARLLHSTRTLSACCLKKRRAVRP